MCGWYREHREKWGFNFPARARGHDGVATKRLTRSALTAPSCPRSRVIHAEYEADIVFADVRAEHEFGAYVTIDLYTEQRVGGERLTGYAQLQIIIGARIHIPTADRRRAGIYADRGLTSSGNIAYRDVCGSGVAIRQCQTVTVRRSLGGLELTYERPALDAGYSGGSLAKRRYIHVDDLADIGCGDRDRLEADPDDCVCTGEQCEDEREKREELHVIDSVSGIVINQCICSRDSILDFDVYPGLAKSFFR